MGQRATAQAVVRPALGFKQVLACPQQETSSRIFRLMSGQGMKLVGILFKIVEKLLLISQVPHQFEMLLPDRENA